MRYGSWLLSFVLHAAVCAVLVQTVAFAPLDIRELMELNLTELEPPVEPDTVVEPLPLPAPSAPPAEVLPEVKVAPPPVPLDKTVVLDDVPPPAAPSVPEEVTVPDEIRISPVKVPEKAAEQPPRRIDVRKGDFVVHRGHEARFGRAMMADYYSYSTTEFSGHFKTKDDRTISIIDARNTKYGRFLIYDSKNKTLRRMKQALGKYVYTIGPSLYADEPVAGTVTFLAKNDRIERFILQTDDDRIAHYPRKVHVRETDIHFAVAGGEREGWTSLPPSGDGHDGIVFVHGNVCADQGLVQGFLRALSMHGIASLSFMPDGCFGDDPSPGPAVEMVSDIRSGLNFMDQEPQLAGGRLGIWGNGPGVPLAVQSVLSPHERKPDFLVCLLNDTLSPDDMVSLSTLKRLSLPTLWIVTGRRIGSWSSAISTLESLRDEQGKPFTVVIAPLKGGAELEAASGEQSALVEQVADDTSRLAVSWIKSLPR